MPFGEQVVVMFEALCAATKTVPTKGESDLGAFERLPVEVVLDVLACHPSALSVLSATCAGFRALAVAHRSALAERMLGVDNARLLSLVQETHIVRLAALLLPTISEHEIENLSFLRHFYASFKRRSSSAVAKTTIRFMQRTSPIGIGVDATTSSPSGFLTTQQSRDLYDLPVMRIRMTFSLADTVLSSFFLPWPTPDTRLKWLNEPNRTELEVCVRMRGGRVRVVRLGCTIDQTLSSFGG